jgi:hypothetical protein
MDGVNRKIAGATLIETLVAMILLTTTISLTFFSITRIKRSFNNELRAYSYLVLSSIIEQDTLSQDNEVLEYPSFTIYRTAIYDEKNPSLLLITASAVMSDSIVLCQIKKYKKLNPGNSRHKNEK